jgi:hypothetical protein
VVVNGVDDIKIHHRSRSNRDTLHETGPLLIVN